MCLSLNSSKYTGVSDISLRDTRPNTSEQRVPLDVWSWNIMEQTEEVGSSRRWTEEETLWLISVWGDTTFKQMTSRTTLDETSASTLLQSVRWVNIVAQSGSRSQLDTRWTMWTVGPKKLDLRRNRIRLQSECTIRVAGVTSHLECKAFWGQFVFCWPDLHK